MRNKKRNAIAIALAMAIVAVGSVQAIDTVSPGADIVQYFVDRGVSASAVTAAVADLSQADLKAMMAVLRTDNQDDHDLLNSLVLKALYEKAFAENVQAAMVLGDKTWIVSPGSLSDWE